MQWVELSARQRARRRFAVIGAAVIVASLAGLLVGWSEAQSKDLTPAEVVAFRFPSTWSNLAARPASAITAFAKQNQVLFDPSPSYDLASADSKPVIPGGVLAYADPVESVPPSSAAPRAPEARPAERKAPPRPRNLSNDDDAHPSGPAWVRSRVSPRQPARRSGAPIRGIDGRCGARAI